MVDAEPEVAPVLPQVLLGTLRPLIRGLVVDALRDAPVELVGDDASRLRPPGGSTPPIVIIEDGVASSRQYERDFLLARPDAVVLKVHGDGATLCARALYPQRDHRGELSERTLTAMIGAVSPWERRFTEVAE